MRIELITDDGWVYDTLEPVDGELWRSSTGELVNMAGKREVAPARRWPSSSGTAARQSGLSSSR